MQKWKVVPAGTLNIALNRSITTGWSVVGQEPMPSARAASIKFWVAGTTDNAPPPAPTPNAKMMQGASLMSSANWAALRYEEPPFGRSSNVFQPWSARFAHQASLYNTWN